MEKTEKATRALKNVTVELCGAKARHNNHQPCRQPAMKNGRCRLHGGKCTGPKTPEGKRKAAMAPVKHGRYTKAAIAERKIMTALLREWNDDIGDIEQLEHDYESEGFLQKATDFERGL